MLLRATGPLHILSLLTVVLLISSTSRIPSHPSYSLIATPGQGLFLPLFGYIAPGTFTSKQLYSLQLLYIDLCECFIKNCLPLGLNSMRSGTVLVSSHYAISRAYPK